ncbi:MULTISPECIES: hypothetical protein [unclassified Mesorhizobium]|uniref:hypothetical protein n=1 Tax=unclassified Mesorhizobium TaxID=325217 RepID=UPI0010935B93|nr:MULTISPECIES: hypothetical protein [unclassified Mesorhizobium]TGQ80342.1 hypothetical protein EN850_13795 [Mesorhizobium sp. M8A.F.Ca.ET.207.01.1.1]TGT87087.1 hypothetical protein EN804_18460 [Mesorhizobium sp. M8A.F.Ca.ET.161.01.1.1]TGV40952.1 hypothetical protein EN785_18445 [Mesorhizobium sp. M8A.F.Ca.ET.142.01.1.1]
MQPWLQKQAWNAETFRRPSSLLRDRLAGDDKTLHSMPRRLAGGVFLRRRTAMSGASGTIHQSRSLSKRRQAWPTPEARRDGGGRNLADSSKFPELRWITLEFRKAFKMLLNIFLPVWGIFA